MFAKTLFWGTVLILAVSLEVPAADIGGKITLKGEPKKGAVMISYFGVAENGKLDEGDITGSEGSEGMSKTGEGKAEIDIRGKGTEWTWSVQGVHPGYHLLWGMFIAEGHDVMDWHYPMAWKWAQVKDEKEKLAVDLVIDLAVDPKQLGAIDVAAPAGKPFTVLGILPIDGLDLSSPAGRVVAEAAAICDNVRTRELLTAPAQKLTLKGLLPGKYRIASAVGQADVEVKAGETIKATLVPAAGAK